MFDDNDKVLIFLVPLCSQIKIFDVTAFTRTTSSRFSNFQPRASSVIYQGYYPGRQVGLCPKQAGPLLSLIDEKNVE